MDQQQGPGGQAVWDGTAWVVPGTPWRWDGTAWVDASASVAWVNDAAPTGLTWDQAAPTPPPTGPPISAGRVFFGVAWRSWLVCIVGGGLAAFLGAIAIGIGARETEGILFSVVVAFVGAVFGLLLGVIAAPVMGGICAARLVPYPGRRSALLTARVPALVIVALFLPLVFWDAVWDDLAVVILAGIIGAASLVGAWFGGGWTVRWYVRHMEAHRPG